MKAAKITNTYSSRSQLKMTKGIKLIGENLSPRTNSETQFMQSEKVSSKTHHGDVEEIVKTSKMGKKLKK